METVHFEVHVKLLYLHPYTSTDLKLKGSAAAGSSGCISGTISPGLLTDKVVKAARKRFFFFRRLKKFGMESVILTNFY